MPELNAYRNLGVAYLMNDDASNAENAFKIRRKVGDDLESVLSSLQKQLRLKNIPKRMECFDISNIRGKQAVGSMVTFENGLPAKNRYKRYKVKTVSQSDDYAMMYEVLTRRYTRAFQEDDFPDLTVIDGGKGQLAKAEAFFSNIEQVKTPLLVGVAKGESRKPGLETLILAGSHQLISLPATSPALHLVQHIRDESHRFAITGHRAKRQKVSKKSALENIEGVGAKKRQTLLTFLGGMQEVKKAELTELEKVPGISKTLAKNIYAALHDK